MRLRASRSGFTLIELLVVVTIAGILLAMALRPVGRAISRTQLATAKSVALGKVAAARTVAVSRSCPAVVHFRPAAAGSVWVTACGTGTTGRVTAREIVGPVDSLTTRYGVTLASAMDSLVFDPRGLAPAFAGGWIKVSMASPALSDSFRINALGKVIR